MTVVFTAFCHNIFPAREVLSGCLKVIHLVAKSDEIRFLTVLDWANTTDTG